MKEINLEDYKRESQPNRHLFWFDYLDLSEDLDTLYGIISTYDSHKGFRVERSLGNKTTRELWSAVKGNRLVWVVAELTTRYENHRYYEELSDALREVLEGICTIQQ